MYSRLLSKRYVYIVFTLLFSGCQFIAGDNMMASELKKEENDFMQYSLGRYLFQVPDTMQLSGKGFVVGYAEIKEIPWKDKKNRNNEKEIYWNKYREDINSKTPPDGVEKRLIESVDLTDKDKWSNAALYYSRRTNKRKIKWSVFTEYENVGLLVSIEGGIKFVEPIKKGVKQVVGSYVPLSEKRSSSLIDGPKYYTEYGVFRFPFDEAEELYLRFEGHPLKLKLEIETEVVDKVEKTNLIERLSAALAANFAPGVSVDKIRTEQRTVAGLKGDEVIMRGTEGKKSELSFAWRFNGEKNSATAPRITIEMESPDGQLEEKLAIWDAVLDSMQVIPQ